MQSYRVAMTGENFSAIENQEKLDLDVYKIKVNLRAKELRKNPKGLYLIKPRNLTQEETLEIFKVQTILQ